MLEIVLVDLEQTCYASPSQWSGTTSAGAEFYVRYRWSGWRIDLDKTTVCEGSSGRDGLDGKCSFDEIKKWAKAKNVLIHENPLEALAHG